jgi:hypothetical protein
MSPAEWEQLCAASAPHCSSFCSTIITTGISLRIGLGHP